MARHSRLKVLNAVVNTGLAPIFYNADVEVAKNVAKACAAGGAAVLEFTNRGDFAPEVFKELSLYLNKEEPDIILGVGSVMDAPTAALYIAYGANFVVSPVLNEEMAWVCNRRKIAFMPGCGSVSEISRAEELGVEIVKIFPGTAVGGPSFIKSVLAPCPWTRIMPTGGVEPTEENLKAWFDAGAVCVGMGSKLVRKDLVASGDWDGISKLTRETLDLIQKVRGEPKL